MTYQEKYEELFKNYNNATKALNAATQKIAFINGFGDTKDLSNYFEANRKYKFAEREFNKLLNYATSENLNPATEYIPQEYMYNFIKKDQQRRGIIWKDEDLIPKIKNGVKAYDCLIGLTNDGEINWMIQGTEYKFPVLNLMHGRECYGYLVKMLQEGGDEVDIDGLKFTLIEDSKPIFVRIVITVWQ